jgi:hypothetical protein
MKSFLKQIKEKFIVIESAEYCDFCNRPNDQCVCKDEEIDEISTTGAVAGYNTPTAFAKPGKWRNKDKTYESVNTPPTFRWKDDTYQHPESEEEVMNDKFPFSDNEQDWYNKSYEYPSKHMPNKPHRTSTNKPSVFEMMDTKYEQLIESYRAYSTGDAKSTPEQKIKHTIKEVARQLQEIERTVNYASRLKTESGVARNGYGSAVESALAKISERLIKISERVRALGE